MVATVSTPVFDGPIDLLLQLVTSHEVDLYDVPLAAVVDAFIDEVLTGDPVDLPTVSEFLMVAAVLVELKSKWLLPGHDAVDEDEELTGWEERDLLLARLLECQAYAAAADAFAVLTERASRCVQRTAGIDEGVVVNAPDLLEGVTADQVAAAYLRATAERPVPVVDLYHVTVETVTVTDAVAHLERRLPVVRSATFRSLTSHLGTRMEVIVTFLALLELCKRGRVDLDQGHTFGELQVSWVAGPGGAAAPADSADRAEPDTARSAEVRVAGETVSVGGAPYDEYEG